MFAITCCTIRFKSKGSSSTKTPSSIRFSSARTRSSMGASSSVRYIACIRVTVRREERERKKEKISFERARTA